MKRLPKNTLTKGGESRAMMEPSRNGAADACRVVRRPAVARARCLGERTCSSGTILVTRTVREPPAGASAPDGALFVEGDLGVDGTALQDQLVVKVRAGTATSAAAEGDLVAALDTLAGHRLDLLQVPEPRLD